MRTFTRDIAARGIRDAGLPVTPETVEAFFQRMKTPCPNCGFPVEGSRDTHLFLVELTRAREERRDPRHIDDLPQPEAFLCAPCYQVLRLCEGRYGVLPPEDFSLLPLELRREIREIVYPLLKAINEGALPPAFLSRAAPASGRRLRRGKG